MPGTRWRLVFYLLAYSQTTTEKEREKRTFHMQPHPRIGQVPVDVASFRVEEDLFVLLALFSTSFFPVLRCGERVRKLLAVR